VASCLTPGEKSQLSTKYDLFGLSPLEILEKAQLNVKTRLVKCPDRGLVTTLTELPRILSYK